MVWIHPHSSNFNFHILFSCTVPPEFFRILLHGTHVFIYNFTKEYKRRSSRKIISRVISQWFWCKYYVINFILDSPSTRKKLQATYTGLKRSQIFTLSFRLNLSSLRRKEMNRNNDNIQVVFQAPTETYSAESVPSPGPIYQYNSPFYTTSTIFRTYIHLPSR